MACLTARVASSTRRTTAQTEGWAIGLDMAKSLTVVALLGWVHCQCLLSPHVYGEK